VATISYELLIRAAWASPTALIKPLPVAATNEPKLLIRLTPRLHGPPQGEWSGQAEWCASRD
jgi:hypothetical protein